VFLVNVNMSLVISIGKHWLKSILLNLHQDTEKNIFHMNLISPENLILPYFFALVL